MLTLYRRALTLRRFLSGPMRWADTPVSQMLSLTRGDVLCTVNLGDEPVEIGTPGRLMLASGVTPIAGDQVTLPAATAAWWDTAAV